MLSFKETFKKYLAVGLNDRSMIMACKNIDFGCVMWTDSIFTDNDLVFYIIDNIVDINAKERGNGSTLLQNIIFHIRLSEDCSIYDSKLQISYLLNNGHINISTLQCYSSGHIDDITIRRKCYKCDNIAKYIPKVHNYVDLIDYLTRISLGRFTKFYNIEKYYDTCTTMLLIIKAQSKDNTMTNRKLPPSIMKHLILPFVYQ